MKILPIFEYYDNSESTVGNPMSRFEWSNMAHQLYVFSKQEKSNEIVVRNTAKNTEEVLVLNQKKLKKHLLKEYLIN